MDSMRMNIDYEALKRLENKYTKELTHRAFMVIDTYTRKVYRDAKEIIEKEGYHDTGKLINSLSRGAKVYAGKITGEVNAGAKHSRFIHEGAKHEGDTKIVRHYVPFKAAPSLFEWAVRNGVIYQKTKQNKRAKTSTKTRAMAALRIGTWYFKSKRTGKEYAIDARKGGLPVMTKAAKFFETPFEAVKDEFVKELSRIVGGAE